MTSSLEKRPNKANLGLQYFCSITLPNKVILENLESINNTISIFIDEKRKAWNKSETSKNILKLFLDGSEENTHFLETVFQLSFEEIIKIEGNF